MSTFSFDLDAAVDSMPDLPEFKPYPVGVHKVTMNAELDESGDAPVVTIKMRYIESVEVSDPTVELPATGASDSCRYKLSNEFSAGALKNVLRPVGEHFGIGSTRDVISSISNLEVLVQTKHRTDKTDKTKKYTDIVTVAVV
jgi:hypothetical protein